MATYVVTGGCGFIGSHLAESLLTAGHQVVILDNLSTGKRKNAPKQAALLVGDVRDKEAVQKVLQGADGCFHLAAIASVQKSNEEWLETHEVNVSGTVTVLEMASKMQPVVPVVYASSAAVYGDSDHLPLSEQEQAHPITAYGIDKFASEQHAEIADRIHHVPNIGLRFFNVYGPRQDPSSPYSGVISKFMESILHDRDITIFGDGSQERDFVYVSDIVKALMTSMDYVLSHNKCHEVMNVCSGQHISVKSLAKMIEELTGHHVTWHYKPRMEGDIYRSYGDNSHLQEVLHIHPETTLRSGLEMLVAHWLEGEQASKMR